MGKRLFLFVFLLVATVMAYTQMPLLGKDGTVVIVKEDVKITMVPYARNIVKITLQPKGYLTNELISDAVIMKPMKGVAKIKSDKFADYAASWGNMQFAVKGDTFFFGPQRNALICKPVK